MRTNLPRRIVAAFLMLCALWTVALAAQSARPLPDEAALARMLRDGPAHARVAAIAVIARIPVDERSPLLFAALLEELDRLRQQLEDREIALRSGQPRPPSPDHGEYLFSVLEIVTQHTDNPAIIPALIPFIGAGNRVSKTLAGFGDAAVIDLATIAESPLSRIEDAGGAMLTLRRMLLNRARQPLSPQSRQLITRVAGERLNTSSSLGVLITAVELAAATGDPALLERVRAIAADPAAGRAGTMAATDAQQLRQRAAAAVEAAEARATRR